MFRDIVLGSLLTSALTTETGRKAVGTVSKIGLKMLENNLKNSYGVDIKAILSEDNTKSESEDNKNE